MKNLVCEPALFETDLLGTVTIVTGANSGSGLATVEQLVRQGFQLVLLEADRGDIKDAVRSGPTDYHNARLSHPIVASMHIGFTCSSCTQVKRVAEMAKAEGILEHGPLEKYRED